METGISSCILDKKWSAVDKHKAGPDENFFAACAEHGIRRVELTVMERYIEPGDWDAVERMRGWADQYGVIIHSVHGPSGWPTNGHWLGDPDEDARKRNVRERLLALEGARRMGARYMVVEFEAYDQWPFWPHSQKPAQVFPKAAEQWRRSFDELLPAADRASVALAIENVDGSPLEAVSRLYRLAKTRRRNPGQVAVSMLDPGGTGPRKSADIAGIYPSFPKN